MSTKCSVPECKNQPFKENYCIDHYRKLGSAAKGAPAAATPAANPNPAPANNPLSPRGAATAGSDWKDLQKKIFTRWVNQKLSPRKMAITDVVKGWSKGLELVALLEILSEKQCKAKLNPNASIRVALIDNVNPALQFLKDCGVQLELKPSAENLVDGEEKSVLGMVWGIMKTFLKFGDDEDSKMSAVDALRMWCQNQVGGKYKGVDIQDFGKSWHNGLAFAALIHKFRPKLIDFDKLNPKEDEKNIKIAMEAAEKFFGLEQYLHPSDIKKLDDKSMVIYVSEYYYGIAAQRKIDLAARRLGKLIAYTDQNDKMKIEYNEKAAKLKGDMAREGKTLGDRTIDNTMEGAKKRIEAFTEYKAKAKGVIVSDFLSSENIFGTLSVRLADHKRPAFKPNEGLGLEGLRSALADLEKCEQERKVALYAELNRQIKLANFNEQHKTRCDAVAAWGKEKEVSVSRKETIESVGAAEYHLNALSAFNAESEALQKGTFEEIKKLGKELVDEKFEHSSDVQSREAAVVQLFLHLNKVSADKKAVLDDDLEREKFKERIRALNRQHGEKHKKLSDWIQEKGDYLKVEEKIASIKDAQLAISILKAYEEESAALVPASVPSLKQLGQEILNARFKGTHTSWQWPTPDDITTREKQVDTGLASNGKLSATKKERLDDDLAREQFKEELRMQNKQHVARHKKISAWVADSIEYLNVKEVIESVSAANLAINQLNAYGADKVVMTNTNVAPLKELGQQILNAEYKGLSQAVWETPDEIREREGWVDENWVKLTELSNAKQARLEDDLAREKFKDQLRLWNSQHVDRHKKISQWVADSEAYLKKKEAIDSVAGAETALGQIGSYEADEKTMSKTNVAPLHELGAKILAAEYKTDLSAWKWPTPDEIKEREAWADQQFQNLNQLAAKKRAVLEDDLGREKFKAKLRLWNANHVDRHKKISDWIDASTKYLGTEEKVDSIAEAETQLTKLKAWDADKADQTNSQVAPLKQTGQDILTAEYKTDLSSWKWPEPQDIEAREGFVDQQWAALAELFKTKLAKLEDDLAREKFKEQLRAWNKQHIDSHGKLKDWIESSTAYLNKKEPVNSTSEAMENLNNLKAYEADKVDQAKAVVGPFKQTGQRLLTAEYKNLTEAHWETPDEVKQREGWVDEQWVVLADLSAKKLAVLKDDVAREQFKDQIRLYNAQHVDAHKKISEWVNDTVTYLQTAEKVVSIPTAEAAIAVLEAHKADTADVTNINVKSLKALGHKTVTSEYKTELSAWIFDNPTEVKQRETNVDESWAKIAELTKQKEKVLADALALEIRKDKLRLKFANQAADFLLWSKETSDNSATTHFGFTLEEVQGFDIKSADSKLADASAAKTQAWKATWDEMTSLEIKENVYTTSSPADLEKAAAHLQDALTARRKRYDEELAKQQHNDSLCRAFAAVADPFVKQMDAEKDKITKSEADLEAQLAYVQERKKAADANNKLDEVKAAQAKIDEAGIKNNRHSAMTARDAEVLWGQYLDFLSTKAKMLAEQIELKKLRGVSPSQYDEIKTQFAQFDKDKSGHIDEKELRACLYSLGYELTNTQIKGIMSEFGSKDAKEPGMKYDGFKEFMIKQLGDTDSPDEMMNGWDMMNRKQAPGVNEFADQVLSETDTQFLRANSPKAPNGGADYAAWIAAALKR